MAMEPASQSEQSTKNPPQEEAESQKWMTSRREFRARAHSNPLADGFFFVPQSPSLAPWSKLFDSSLDNPKVDWLDIGCGYGGLVMYLGKRYPGKFIVGMEIRERVAEYCNERLKEAREREGERKDEEGKSRTDANDETKNSNEKDTEEQIHLFGNVAFVRMNVMKYLTNWFTRASLEKLFFCYPDPHFKRKKNRQRIISFTLLAEYAYVLRPNGILYTVTDVEELHEWMQQRLLGFPLFRRRSASEESNDPICEIIRNQTDEAKRVEKGGRTKHFASYQRLSDPPEDCKTREISTV